MNFERLQMNVAKFRDGEALSPSEVLDDLFSQRIDWFELIKTLRFLYDFSFLETERLALAHPGWRRWCIQQINEDPRCHKMAWHHLKQNGRHSLLQMNGDRFEVRR